MPRTGIIVGVDKTGQLQPPNDATAGARRIHEWAIRQGMPDGTHSRLITDNGGQKVTSHMVYDAIRPSSTGLVWIT